MKRVEKYYGPGVSFMTAFVFTLVAIFAIISIVLLLYPDFVLVYYMLRNIILNK